MERTETGNGIFEILFPVFGGEMRAAKIQTVKGIRVEIFSRLLAKKYYPSLDGLDRRNGAKCGLLFVVGRDIISAVTERQIAV